MQMESQVGASLSALPPFFYPPCNPGFFHLSFQEIAVGLVVICWGWKVPHKCGMT